MTEYKGGYATLPLEKYNELLRRADIPQKLFTVKKSYDGKSLEVRVNEDLMDQVGQELFAMSPLKDGYEYVTPSFWSTTIGKPPVDEE